MAMSEDTRRRLNRAIWIDRAKKAGIGVGLLALIGLFALYQNFDMAVDNTHVAGVVETVDPLVAPASSGTSTAQGLTVGVKLDDGRHVRIVAKKDRDPHVGERIDVVEHHHHTGRVTHSLK